MSLAGDHKIDFDVEKDIRWRWDAVLPEHPNGLAFSVYDRNGDLIAINEYFSVGGGFVVTPRSIKLGGENLYYKSMNREAADPVRRQQDHGEKGDDVRASHSPLALPGYKEDGHPAEPTPETATEGTKWAQPPLPFSTAADLLDICNKHNLTVAQVCWENERHYLSDEEIKQKTLSLWAVMDRCIKEGVSHHEELLPGSLKLRRRAPGLYKRLMRGFYPEVPDMSQPRSSLPDSSVSASAQPTELTSLTSGLFQQLPTVSIRGRMEHPLPPINRRRTVFPAMDFLSAYAIAVNEVNASGGRIVTAPTNGAAGVIPAVAK